jgi:hypothetical protein
MQFTEPASSLSDAGIVACSQQDKLVDDALAQRLEGFLRLHRLSITPLPYEREREFWRIVRIVRHAVDGGDSKGVAEANLALDLLSLDLCND